MAQTWMNLIDWSAPHSIAQLTAGRGARTVIPRDKGFYAFVEGNRQPAPGNCLYLGIAVQKAGLYGRLGSYLRRNVTTKKADSIAQRSKRLIAFARIKGLDGEELGTRNSTKNDEFIHVAWAKAPLEFGATAANDREYAFFLERALIDYYRPLYNTADWQRDMEIDLDDDPFWPLELQ